MIPPLRPESIHTCCSVGRPHIYVPHPPLFVSSHPKMLISSSIQQAMLTSYGLHQKPFLYPSDGGT